MKTLKTWWRLYRHPTALLVIGPYFVATGENWVAWDVVPLDTLGWFFTLVGFVWSGREVYSWWVWRDETREVERLGGSAPSEWSTTERPRTQRPQPASPPVVTTPTPNPAPPSRIESQRRSSEHPHPPAPRLVPTGTSEVDGDYAARMTAFSAAIVARPRPRDSDR